MLSNHLILGYTSFSFYTAITLLQCFQMYVYLYAQWHKQASNSVDMGVQNRKPLYENVKVAESLKSWCDAYPRHWRLFINSKNINFCILFIVAVYASLQQFYKNCHYLIIIYWIFSVIFYGTYTQIVLYFDHYSYFSAFLYPIFTATCYY